MIIDKAKADALDLPERRAYYAEVVRGVYDEIQLEWTEKLERYNAHWQKHERAVNEAFGEQFGRELVGSFNDIQGRMGLNSVCPRFLGERALPGSPSGSSISAIAPQSMTCPTLRGS